MIKDYADFADNLMQRLIELYPIGTAVIILLADGEWVNGRVVVHQHPAVWVQTEDGQRWFVTNRTRIKLAQGHL